MTLKTLIVDDEPIARKVLREELESIPKVEVVGEADNGAVALEQIRQHRPDLVLLDLQMPLMSGLDVVRNLKGGTHIPVIVIVTHPRLHFRRLKSPECAIARICGDSTG